MRIFKKYFSPLVLVIFSGMIIFTAAVTIRTSEQLYSQSALMLKETAQILFNSFHNLSEINPETADSFCKSSGQGSDIRISIIDSGGTVIGDSDADVKMLDSHRDRPEIKESFEGRANSVIRYSRTEKKKNIYYALPVIQDNKVKFVIRVSVNIGKIDQTAAGIRNTTLIIASGMFLSIMLVFHLISKKLGSSIISAAEYLSEKDYKMVSPDLDNLIDSIKDYTTSVNEEIESLTTGKNELAAVLSGMMEAVIVLDFNLNLKVLNQAACQIFKKDPEEIKGRSIMEVFRNTELQEFARKTLNESAPLEEEIIIHDKEEMVFQIHGRKLNSGSTGINSDDNRIVLVLNNITRIKRLEKVRTDFVANVSHELKTPVTSIKGFVETLLDGAMDDKPAAERFLRIIEKQTNQLNAIIEDLLILSRLEQTDSSHLAFQMCRVSDIISNAVHICTDKAAAKNTYITYKCDGELQIEAISVLIEQAIVNLLDNAVKYCPPSSEINIEAVHDRNNIEITVSDNGNGIPAPELPRIFERFYRIDKARSRDMVGSGLGLAIVKHIAISHSGKVSVISEPGNGSAFTITLPQNQKN